MSTVKKKMSEREIQVQLKEGVWEQRPGLRERVVDCEVGLGMGELSRAVAQQPEVHKGVGPLG